MRFIAYELAAVLLVNPVLIADAHFRWEIEATRTTYEQMALLRQANEVVVDFKYFHEPFSECLCIAGVKFTVV
jgi:hypothetical protein